MELWISVNSAIIALSALGVSIWQGYLQRKHNKLSVLPHVTVEFDTRINSDIAVLIKSVGLGPAKFLNYKWVVNDKEFYVRTKKDYWDLLNGLGLENERVEFYCPQLESFLAPGFQGLTSSIAQKPPDPPKQGPWTSALGKQQLLYQTSDLSENREYLLAIWMNYS